MLLWSEHVLANVFCCCLSTLGMFEFQPGMLADVCMWLLDHSKHAAAVVMAQVCFVAA